MGKVWRRRWVDDDFRWVTWRSRFFFHIQKGVRHKTSHHAFWATVGFGSLQTRGRRRRSRFQDSAFASKKREGSNLNHSVCLFHLRNSAFAAFAFHLFPFGWQLEGPAPAQFNWQAHLSSSILSALLPRQFWHRRHGIHSEVPWPWHSRSFAGGHVLVQPLDTLSCDDCDVSVIQ